MCVWFPMPCSPLKNAHAAQSRVKAWSAAASRQARPSSEKSTTHPSGEIYSNYLPFDAVVRRGYALYQTADRLVGLVVKASASRTEDPRFKTSLRWESSGSSHTSDLKIGTPMATLSGARRYRISAGTGRPGVSIPLLGEVESLICKFYLRVAARKIVSADPFPRYTSMLLGH